MSDERRAAGPGPHPSTMPRPPTIMYDGPTRSDAGTGWLFGVVALIAVLAAVYLMAIRGDARPVGDGAVAGATHAAGQVEDAPRAVADR